MLIEHYNPHFSQRWTVAAAPAERRQMVMVNDAFSCLRKRASEGEVSPEVLNKVHQIANDLVARNFHSASTIQAVSYTCIK